ncbi:MAG: hypothetical protein RLZZ318_1120 [Bacteroidota bacterium]
MQVCMVAKQKPDFTIMINKYALILVLFLALSACKKNQQTIDPIPDVPVNITINMALPKYSHLLNANTFVFEDGGVKGVAIVHYKDEEYYAFERCCTYESSKSCAQIEVDSSIMIFRCGQTTASGFQKCCDSKFLFDGSVFNGPATYGLKMYSLTKQGSLITITN